MFTKFLGAWLLLCSVALGQIDVKSATYYQISGLGKVIEVGDLTLVPSIPRIDAKPIGVVSVETQSPNPEVSFTDQQRLAYPAKAARRERVRAAVERDRRLIGWLGLLKHPGERGVGDTAHRLCMRACRSPDASAALQRLLKQCSCSRVDAVARLNTQYPFSASNNHSNQAL